MAVISVKLLNERNSDLWDKYKDLGMFEQNPRLNWDPDIGYYTGVYTGWPEEDDYEVFSEVELDIKKEMFSISKSGIQGA